jgi:aldose 1-epimerase
MSVTTDQPSLQLYTANHLDPPHTAVCLETQRPPNAPNQPCFGSALLRPGEEYRHVVRHDLSW